MCFEANEAEGGDVCSSDHYVESAQIRLKMLLYGANLTAS